MQSLSILSDVDPADFIRSDAPISQFARASVSSFDRFAPDPEQQQLHPQPASNAVDARFSISSRPSVLETAQAFGGTSTGIPRQFQQSSNAPHPAAPQLAAVLPPAPTYASNLMPSSHKTTTIKLPPQVLLVFVDGRNGHAVIDRLSGAAAASHVPLNTGDNLKSIDGHPCSSASEALAGIQSLNNGSGADVELHFVSRSGALLHVVASRQQVPPPPPPCSAIRFTAAT
jgi:hypothetical protein